MRISKLQRALVGGVALALLYSVIPSAQCYARSSTRKETRSSGSSFERSVDLKRLRTGNGEWDTQELVASGLTALHRENEQILQELAEIKAAIQRIEANQ